MSELDCTNTRAVVAINKLLRKHLERAFLSKNAVIVLEAERDSWYKKRGGGFTGFGG